MKCRKCGSNNAHLTRVEGESPFTAIHCMMCGRVEPTTPPLPLISDTRKHKRIGWERRSAALKAAHQKYRSQFK